MSRQEELTKQRHFIIRKVSINQEDIIPRGFTFNKISKRHELLRTGKKK